MKLQDILTNPLKLHKLTAITVWVQALLGGILLMQTWESTTHIVAIVLLAVTVLCVHKGGPSLGARITARVITGLFWLIAVVFVAQIVLTILYSWEYYAEDLLANICYFCGLFLCYFAPATVTVMLYSAEHTVAYDRVTGVACQTALLPVTYLCLFVCADIPWSLDGGFISYVFGVVTVVTTALVWLSAKRTSPVQKNALQQRREARQAKVAARKNA